jgi:NAD(P)-dependent dehydrogenase (short-subunit alcohol dehydrogenase family)
VRLRHLHPVPVRRRVLASKLANLMFAIELDRRAKAAGAQLVSVAVNPGTVKTSLLRYKRDQWGQAARSTDDRRLLAGLDGQVGSRRSSQPGSDQLALPNMCMTAGARTVRSMNASGATAAARPTLGAGCQYAGGCCQAWRDSRTRI